MNKNLNTVVTRNGNVNNICAVKDRYMFAKTVEEALEGSKYILMIKREYSLNSTNTVVKQVRPVKLQKFSERGVHIVEIDKYFTINFYNEENLRNIISQNKQIKIDNNTSFEFYINASNSLEQVHRNII